MLLGATCLRDPKPDTLHNPEALKPLMCVVFVFFGGGAVVFLNWHFGPVVAWSSGPKTIFHHLLSLISVIFHQWASSSIMLQTRSSIPSFFISSIVFQQLPSVFISFHYCSSSSFRNFILFRHVFFSSHLLIVLQVFIVFTMMFQHDLPCFSSLHDCSSGFMIVHQFHKFSPCFTRRNTGRCSVSWTWAEGDPFYGG